MLFHRPASSACAQVLGIGMTCAAIPASFASAQTIRSRVPTIDGSVTVVLNPRETGPVQRATQDLLHDFARVFGRSPKLVASIADAGPVAILVSGANSLPTDVPCATTSDAESFAFSIVSNGVGPTARQIVCLTGADMRGTLYAIYQFSQSVLGVDPMVLWTDKQPARRIAITLPSGFARAFPKPVFRYRGFFINDEDLLSGWMPAARGEHTGISLKVWDNIFATILRLKGNMVVPGTWIFPDDAQVYAATQRGLIVNQHHAISLGVNVARWPKDVPYNFSTHPEILERAWTNAVAEYKPDQEILWSVGLRGLSDASYATLDPGVRNNDPLLGRLISQAIDDQVRIVRARFPRAQFVTDLWQEGARLMQQSYLGIPPEVSLVWADTGYGDMQDGGKVAAGQGAYFHVAMMNGQANQLSELVPVAVIQSELGRYIGAGATSYLLVNTSDIRPVAMTTRALMEVAWGGAPPESTGADIAYYRRWATEEFGARSADALAGIYREYFDAPSLRAPLFPPGLTSAGNAPPSPPPPSGVPRRYGDQHYHSEIRSLILDRLSEHQVIAVPSQSPKWTEPRVLPAFDAEMRRALLARDVDECASAQPRWDAVWRDAIAARSLVEPDRRDYYQAQLLTMIAINRESNRALLHVARALQDDESGRELNARNEAAQALQALAAVEASMSAAEYGKWKNWYRGDWLTGVARTRELVQAYADHLRDPMARLPAPVAWTGWEAYFHIMEYEDDRRVDVH